MICKSCGHELNDAKLFCQYCGTKLTQQEEQVVENKDKENNETEDSIKKPLEQSLDNPEENKKPIYNKKGSKKKIIAIVSLAVLGILAISVLTNLNSATNTFKEYIDSGDYGAALELYKKNENKDDFIKNAGDYTLNEAITIIEGYRKNIVEAKDAITVLKKLDDFTNTSESIKEIEKMEESKKNYKIGMQYAESKAYNLAIINLRKTIEEDSNYMSAQDKIQELKSLFRSEAIAKSDEQLKLKNYEEALNPLYAYNAVIPDKEIDGMIEKIKTDIELVKAAEKEEFIDNIKSKISIIYDDVDDDYTIVPKGYSARYINTGWKIHAEPRIIVNKSSNILAYNFGFSNDDWVFFEKIKFSSGDDKYKLDVDYFDRDSQVIGGGNISEWVFLIHSDLFGELVKKVVNFDSLIELVDKNIDNEITIRFSGTGYLDFVLSQAEKQNLVDFYKLANLLDEDSTLFDELNN